MYVYIEIHIDMCVCAHVNVCSRYVSIYVYRNPKEAKR